MTGWNNVDFGVFPGWELRNWWKSMIFAWNSDKVYQNHTKINENYANLHENIRVLSEIVRKSMKIAKIYGKISWKCVKTLETCLGILSELENQSATAGLAASGLGYLYSK